VSTRTGAARRQLATVLFTDIARSTELAAELGDARWRTLIRRHHQTVRKELRRHGGREVDTAGDGFFATFQAPAAAVECAYAVVRAVRDIGLEIRAGVHTGEVEPIGDKVGGIAVHVGARLMALAQPGEVLVSNTVHDLVSGSDLGFADRGVHALRGLPAEWQVWALDTPALAEVPLADPSVVAADLATGTKSRRLGLAIVGVAVTLAVVGAAAWFLGQRAAVVPAPDTAIAMDRSDGEFSAVIDVGRGPSSVSADRGRVWVADETAGTVSRLDRTAGESEALGQVGARPSTVLVDGDLVWVSDPWNDLVSVLDARDGRLLRQLEDIHARDLAAGYGSVWAADDLADSVVRIDPTTFAVVATIALAPESGPGALASDASGIWVAASRSDRLLRIDPQDNAITGPGISVTGPARVAAGAGALWVTGTLDDSLTKIDPGSGRVVTSVEVCDTPTAVAAGDEGAWVACTVARSVARVDPEGSIIEVIPMDAAPTGIDLDTELAWVVLRTE
jgi:class 3 adenylate cyclase/streptogramin lyase